MDGIEYQKVFDNSVGIETCLGIRKYVISVSIRKYVMKSFNRKHVKKPLLRAFRLGTRTRNSFNC
jgi:hypothetical protein